MATIAYDLLSLFTAFIIYGNGGITYINGLIVEEFLQDYQAGEAVTTWVASAQISLCLISAFLAGTLVELYGNRIVTIIGTLLAVVGFVATVFATHVGQLFVTFSLLTGVGIGLQFVPTLVVPQYVFYKRRTLAVAFILAGCSTGAFILPIMFTYLREEYGYRGALLIWAGIMLNSVPLAMLMTMHPQIAHLPLRPEPIYPDEEPSNDLKEAASAAPKTDHMLTNSNGKSKRKDTRKIHYEIDDRQEPNCDNSKTEMDEIHDHTSLSEIKTSTENQDSEINDSCEDELAEQPENKGDTQSNAKHSLGQELRRAFVEMKQGIFELRDGSCQVLIVVVFFHACGYMMPYIFLPGKVLQMGFSKERAAWLISAIGIAETCSRLLSGVIGSIFRKQLVVFYALSILTSGVGSIGMLLATTFKGFIVVSVIYGIGLGSSVTLYTQAAIVIIGIAKIVRMIGLISLAWGIAYLISPSLGAFVYEATSNVDVPFYMGSALQLLAAVILFSYRVCPMYHTRPGAMDDVTDKEDDEDLTVSPHDVIVATSQRSLHTLASTQQFVSHLDFVWGSGAWVGSTHSRMSSNARAYP